MPNAVVYSSDEAASQVSSGGQLKKQIVRVGTYHKHGTGQTAEITPEKLQQFVDAFRVMMEAGNKVPVVEDHVVSAETSRGYIDDMWIEGDGLIATMTLDDRGRELAKTNDDSIYYQDDFQCPSGEVLSSAITHVAIVPDPVIGGLSGWFAASQASGVDVFQAAQEEIIPMPNFAKVQELLGLETEVNEENFDTVVLPALEEMVKMLDEATAEGEEDTPPAEPPSSEPEGEPNAEMVALSQDAIASFINENEANGNISPKQADMLREQYSANVGLSLSYKAAKAEITRLIAFSTKSGVALSQKSQTGQQHRKTDLGGADPNESRKSVIDQMSAHL